MTPLTEKNDSNPEQIKTIFIIRKTIIRVNTVESHTKLTYPTSLVIEKLRSYWCK